MILRLGNCQMCQLASDIASKCIQQRRSHSFIDLGFVRQILVAARRQGGKVFVALRWQV